LAKKIIRQQPISTLGSGHHQAKIHIGLHMQKLKTLGWRYPFYITSTLKMYVKYIKVKSITKTQGHIKNNNYFVFENCFF
jgi:hypothetical protein